MIDLEEYRNTLIDIMGEDDVIAKKSIINKDGTFFYEISMPEEYLEGRGVIINGGLIRRGTYGKILSFKRSDEHNYTQSEFVEIRNISGVNIKLSIDIVSNYYRLDDRKIKNIKGKMDTIYDYRLSELFADLKNGKSHEEMKSKFGLTTISDLSKTRNI